MDVGCRGEGLAIDTQITPAVEQAFSEAAARLPEIDRLYALGLIDRARRGEIGLFALLDGDTVAGAMCYRCVDDEAELVFGFLLSPYAGAEGAFLGKAVARLAQAGVTLARSGFAWPGREGFVAAAAAMGFASIRRISMAKDLDDSYLFYGALSPGLAVLPWSPQYLEEVGRIMGEESEPADCILYPLFGSPEGARQLLLSIAQNRHGTFMPELSAVCLAGGEVAGFVLCSLVADGSVLVLDIAVRKACRRRGAGTQLLRHLFARCAALGKRQVVLAVTAGNEAAIELYKKMGFREITAFDQYVLKIVP